MDGYIIVQCVTIVCSCIVLCVFIWRAMSEEIKNLEAERDAFPQAHRLAMELECLLLSCMDTAATAKWWDSAKEALDQWREFFREDMAAGVAPCARCAELEAKFRKMRPFNGRTRSVQEVEEWSATEAAAFIPAVQEYAADKDRVIDALQAKITEQAERIKELKEEDTEIHRLKDATINAQSDKLGKADAVIEAAGIALQEVQDLIHESHGIYGMHLNGDGSPWNEIERGGRFERLCTLPDALADIELYQKGE